ncbi:nitroreductase family deazaflavin-dependent oxidoreductase [Tsukamurella ocularis]|uniref:nitroreductase family deazaflavin-dependent oxidoreductase n=1 Tax=Tsukamurella ocularis TaxID=1970234 RepID=UPI002169D0A2|nr:nitroreductase family deazaflavin-dependent oxidoreductase [Tsukamurella ocularis]MCS3781827.1 deazaflavin-dependent oxidoreductase (nitroreductase family) [Tsukamurella ocularis]MCS3788321.1 deazaflavin-dependent oxidoreductase (nitroreductase family) [Tsukamurella ocularis]MCS3852041.1 deazaflavin-dependent oxidoreductase (nitroreductase family) [Tsukamurella ocularis]
MSGLRRLGVRTSLATTLETRGRKSGAPRAVPVAATFDAEGAWVVSQHGRRSGWALNVTADPEVRILQGGTWRTGTAEFRPEDDTHARTRSFAPSAALAGITTSAFQALASDPISVRITFVDVR